MLIRIEPEEPGCDLRTYHCAACEDTEVVIAAIQEHNRRLHGFLFPDNPTLQESKNPMIYKGSDFNIIQGITPGVWKWSVSSGGNRGKTGQTKTKPHAVVAAWRAIDQALEPKKTSVTAARR